MALFTCGLTAQNLGFGKWNKFVEDSSNQKKQEITGGRLCFLVTKSDPFFKLDVLQKGDSICRVLDTNHFIVKSTPQNIVSYPEIKYVQANNLWKLAIDHSKDRNVLQLFNIKTSSAALLIDSLRSSGVKIINQNDYVVTIQTNLENIVKEILPLEHVTYISNECLRPVQESIVKDLDLSVNSIFNAQQLYPELKGSGQTIGVKDNLPNVNDIDLLNKIQSSEIASSITDSHATDMATIISGNGNSGVKGLGVIPESVVFPMDFNNLFPDASSVLNAVGVTLVNNSYGTTIENYYGVLAEAYDQFMYDNPTKLHVFSSGNSGSSIADNGIYEGISGYANLTGNFKMFKNGITVGALGHHNEIMPFSSKGPAYDGRVKPEIVAHSILGTSNSAALVTGTASIMQQAYFNINSELPPASLIKAALLNGADDVGRPGVDFETGYGSLNALESLRIINSENYIVDAIENNTVKTYDIVIPANVMELKIMLVWTDMAAQPNDNIALKNNLDSTITHGEDVFFPAVLNTNPGIEHIETLSMEGVDNLNPVEQIVIEEPKAGTYTINVQATSLDTSSQEFSLVYTWENQEDFEWIYPIADSKLPYNGGGVGYIRWDASFQDNKLASLQISYDESDVWDIIDGEVDLNVGYYKWELPELLHAKAQLRFVIDGVNQLSGIFTISNGLDVITTLNCEDVTEITWNKKENTAQYNIFNLQNDEMELVGSTTDTMFAFSKAIYSNPYFSVSPLLDSGTESLGSETVNTTAFPEKCYFNYVFASLVDQKVSIEVSISSKYNIKSLEGFRVNEDDSLTQISLVNDLDVFVFNLLDENPSGGQNTYIFKVTTTNEEEYFSQKSSVRYFSEQDPFLVFPNPTTLEAGIVIYSGLSQNETALFELYDLNGRLILSETLTSDVAFLPLVSSVFSKGLYVYEISRDTVKTKFAKKIIIH